MVFGNCSEVLPEVFDPIPKMQSFEYLSGDVYWRVYGCVWYRSMGEHKYEIIHLWRNSGVVDRLYHAEGYVINTSLGGHGNAVVLGALDAVGVPLRFVRDELELLWTVWLMLIGVPLFDIVGCDPDELFAEAKSHVRWNVDPVPCIGIV